jgi:hypothetical protein
MNIDFKRMGIMLLLTLATMAVVGSFIGACLGSVLCGAYLIFALILGGYYFILTVEGY